MTTAANRDLNKLANDLTDDVKAISGKTILISGGAGFIGSYLVATLFKLNRLVLTKPCRVISIDNYITGWPNNFLMKIKDKKFLFLHGDVRLLPAIDEPVDYIIHAAGLASPYYYRKYPLETIESAVWGAKNLLELARLKQIRGMVFFSSSEIYGNPDPQFVPTPETYSGNVSSIGPRACYDESKRLAETLCITYYQLYRVPTKVVRLFNVYGPGMKHTDYRVIPTFIYRGLKKQNLPVHDKGIQTRTFCYVTDAIAGVMKVLLGGRPGEVYNIGNDKPEVSMYELATIVARLINNGVKPRRKGYPATYPAGEPQRRCPDITKISKELNYIPKVSLHSGLKKTIAWFKNYYNF